MKGKKLKAVIGEYGGKERLQNRKRKFENMDPKDDQQEMPRKVREIMEWQAKQKHSKGKPQLEKDLVPFKMERGFSRPLERVPEFKQKKNESNKKFKRRMEKAVREVLHTNELEHKYKVRFMENEKGETVVQKRPKRISNRKKEKDKEKKKMKKLKEQEKKFDKKPDFYYLKDKVEFGEVVMEPPNLTAKPRISQQNQEPKTESWKKSLILNGILAGEKEHPEQPVTHKQRTSLATRKIGQTVKRKHLSLAQQRITDKQRQLAVDQYRALRDSKLKTKAAAKT